MDRAMIEKRRREISIQIDAIKKEIKAVNDWIYSPEAAKLPFDKWGRDPLSADYDRVDALQEQLALLRAENTKLYHQLTEYVAPAEAVSTVFCATLMI